MATTDLSVYDKKDLPNAETFRFGIVVSDWNDDITHNMLKGALDTFNDLNVSEKNIKIVHVPGSVELVYGAAQLSKGNLFDAIIIIGCVIRGETTHFDYVCQAVTEGVAHLNLTHRTPVIFCLLTDENKQQSIDRSGGKHGNKGVEAAVTAVKMAKVKKLLI